eukprot:365214-Chlamydomonas_euryale.AAC.2
MVGKPSRASVTLVTASPAAPAHDNTVAASTGEDTSKMMPKATVTATISSAAKRIHSTLRRGVRNHACDAVASKYGLLIYAMKTEMMVAGRPMTLPTFKLSGKELLVTDSFKYLGAFFADDGSMSREMDVQNVRALAAFCEFQDIWASPKLSSKQKMDV